MIHDMYLRLLVALESTNVDVLPVPFGKVQPKHTTVEIIDEHLPASYY